MIKVFEGLYFPLYLLVALLFVCNIVFIQQEKLVHPPLLQ
jgi:hypothetical protein